MKNAPKHVIFMLLILLIASFTTATVAHADDFCGGPGDLACPPLIPTSSSPAAAGDTIYAADWVDPFQAGGDRLTALQNDDGGWDWPLDDGNPANVSPKNTLGPIAMGLAHAYLETNDPAHLATLSDAGGLLLSKTNNFSSSDGYLAAQLDAIFGGTTYVDHMTANFYGPLAAGTYDRNGAGTLYTTADYVNAIRAYRAGVQANLAAWDIGMGLVAAASAGASTTDWIAGLKAEIDELNGDGTEYYDVIGLAGAVYGLAFVGEDYDPTAGEHAAASSLADLAAILAGYQLSTGGFTWTATATTPNSDETIQETAYALLALHEFNPTTYFDVIQDAVVYTRLVQLGTGGWEGYPGSGENNEITGEALWAISYATVPQRGAFNGSVEIVVGNSQPIVAVSRPHLGSEVLAYEAADPAPTVYLPMLFNSIWGYSSTFTVQNASNATATFSLTFKDAATGTDSCVISGESLLVHGVKTYDVTNLGPCDTGTLPTPWYGGVVIASDEPVAAMATPKINGSDMIGYNAFSGGAATAYLPMLFKDKWGYMAALYVQNLDDTLAAHLSFEFYDTDGNHTCTFADPVPVAPGASHGIWMGSINNINCIGGVGFPAGGWAGSAVITSTGSNNIVAIGRPHLGTEVAAYNGFTSGSTTSYLPMLFRGMWGYDSAFYVQNISGSDTTIEITFYDIDGNEVCIFTDPAVLAPKATRGYWLPSLHCNDARDFDPAGWAGSAKIVTSEDAIAVGRPHLSGGQVVAYSALPGGETEAYLPFNFRMWNGNETAIYIQNLGGVDADVEITFFDEEDGFYCRMNRTVAPGSSGAIWLASLTEATCYPLP